MFNDSQWKQIGEMSYSLRAKDEKSIAAIYYDERYNNWLLEGEDGLVEYFYAKTNDEAIWIATVKINNHCNKQIANYMKIREHLPELGKLHDKAFGN